MQIRFVIIQISKLCKWRRGAGGRSGGKSFAFGFHSLRCSKLKGKLFVECVALIYLSCIKKQMEGKSLFRTCTMHEVLDELDTIECLLVPGKAPILGEALKKQEQLYLDLGVRPLQIDTEAGWDEIIVRC